MHTASSSWSITTSCCAVRIWSFRAIYESLAFTDGQFWIEEKMWNIAGILFSVYTFGFWKSSDLVFASSFNYKKYSQVFCFFFCYRWNVKWLFYNSTIEIEMWKVWKRNSLHFIVTKVYNTSRDVWSIQSILHKDTA